MTTTADTSTEDLRARRREVLEITGWGTRFHLVQPRNACFWVYLLLVALGIHALLPLVLPTVGVFSDAYTASLATAGSFGLVFLLVLRRIDRWERTPAKLAVAAFVGGGLAAPWVMALPGNAAMMDLYAKIFGQAFATDWEAGLTAPFVEETAKGIIFLLLLGLAPSVIRTVYDGLIVGAFVGLGFQVLEDMLYGRGAAFSHFGVDQVGSVLHSFALRSATGVASHALYTAVFAAGLIYLLGTRAQPRRAGRGILLVLGAMLMHGLWDSMLALAGGNPFVSIALFGVLTLLPILLLVAAIRLGANQERDYMRAVLAPEVAVGVLTEAELQAVAGDRRRRRHDRRSAVAARGDRVSRRREKHVRRAALDLAQDLARSGGEDSPAVRSSREEITRVRHLDAAGAHAGPA